MVNAKIVLSKPGDYTASFYEKLQIKISDIDKSLDISIKDILSLEETLFYLITNAKSSLDLMAPFQTNIDGKLLSNIEMAIDDGVDVRILTRYCMDDERCFDRGKIANKVRHFDHTENSKKKGSLHAKVIIRDRKEVYFGSGELMETSLNDNLEIGILTEDPKIVTIICNIFDSAWELAQ